MFFPDDLTFDPPPATGLAMLQLPLVSGGWARETTSRTVT